MTTGQVLFGLILVVLGILLIMDNVDLIDIDFGVIWPLVLVFAGVYIILKEFETSKRRRQLTGQGEEVK